MEKAYLKEYDNILAYVELEDYKVKYSKVYDVDRLRILCCFDTSNQGIWSYLLSRQVDRRRTDLHVVFGHNATPLDEMKKTVVCNMEDGVWLDFERYRKEGILAYHDVLVAGGVYG